MEKEIGRYLSPGEVVHHIDGDRSNNSLSNLELFETNGKHLASELKGRIPKWTEEGKANMQVGVDSLKKLPQDVDEFRESYMTMRQIDMAKKYSVSPATVRATAKRLRVPLSSAYRSPPAIMREDLADLVGKYRVQEIADMKDIPFQTVYYLMKKYGIPTSR